MKDLFSEYSAILTGLAIGALAHFGRLYTEGKMPSFLQTIGYLMQLGLVGLASLVITKKLGITDQDIRALTTAIFAMSTNEVVQFIKRRSWDKVRKGFAIAMQDEDHPKED